MSGRDADLALRPVGPLHAILTVLVETDAERTGQLVIGGTTLSFYFNYALVTLGVAVIVFGVTRRLERSWVGMHFDAVRIDEVAASTFGLNVQGLKIVAFVIGNVFAGMAGAVFAMMTGFISPTDFDFSTSLPSVSTVCFILASACSLNVSIWSIVS